MAVTAPSLPLLIEEVEVVAVERLSPSFVRVELGSPALVELGVDPTCSYDQRIKMIFAEGDHPLPSFVGADESWYAGWLDRPVAERGHMRTYTVRAVRGEGEQTRLVVDVVLHAEGAHGPGGDWAARVRVGDRVVATAPRAGHAYGGIEFVPGSAERLLLVGDETAVPAVAAILEQLDDDARGAVFLEVPLAADLLDLEHPSGVSLTWLPREARARGEALRAAVLEHLHAQGRAAVEISDEEVDPDLWETPAYSSSGEEVPNDVEDRTHSGLYAWIAGESKVVTGLRRSLVKELGIDRSQVAFMGYWREGVAMGS